MGTRNLSGERARRNRRVLLPLLWHLQQGRCGLCDNPLRDITWEHLIPVSLGGSHRLENLSLYCYTCNQRRGQKPLTDAQEQRLRAWFGDENGYDRRHAERAKYLQWEIEGGDPPVWVFFELQLHAPTKRK